MPRNAASVLADQFSVAKRGRVGMKAITPNRMEHSDSKKPKSETSEKSREVSLEAAEVRIQKVTRRTLRKKRIRKPATKVPAKKLTASFLFAPILPPHWTVAVEAAQLSKSKGSPFFSL
jgi:hypothetical protein